MNGCMKRVLLLFLALLLMLQGAFAATLTIKKSWAQVRARPDVRAPVLSLAFGNDTLPLVKRSGRWVAIRLPDGRLGWLASKDIVERPGGAPATAHLHPAPAAKRPDGAATRPDASSLEARPDWT